jgi:hypothetical protein
MVFVVVFLQQHNNRYNCNIALSLDKCELLPSQFIIYTTRKPSRHQCEHILVRGTGMNIRTKIGGWVFQPNLSELEQRWPEIPWSFLYLKNSFLMQLHASSPLANTGRNDTGLASRLSFLEEPLRLPPTASELAVLTKARFITRANIFPFFWMC